MLKKLMMFLVIPLLLSCSYSRPIEFSNEPNLELIESVFRYQFKNNHSSLKTSANAYCLYVKNYNLESRFLERFGNISPTVLSKQECENKEEVNTVYFRLFEFYMIGPSRVHVYGGYFENGLSSAKNKYTVVKGKDGMWRVVRKKLIWIS